MIVKQLRVGTLITQRAVSLSHHHYGSRRRTTTTVDVSVNTELRVVEYRKCPPAPIGGGGHNRKRDENLTSIFGVTV